MICSPGSKSMKKTRFKTGNKQKIEYATIRH